MEEEKTLRHLKRTLLLRCALRTALLTILGWVIFKILVDGILNDYLAKKMYNMSHSLYYFFVGNKTLAMMGFTAIITLVSGIYAASKLVDQIQLVIKATGKILDKKEEHISLPTEMKPLEERLNQIRDKSLRDERIAKEAESRKNDLIVYIAHDLKTPLTSVIGYLTLLNEEEKISEELRQKYLKISLTKAERLEELINEFFDITRLNLQGLVLEKEEINLSMMLQQLVDEFYPQLASKNLTIGLSMEENVKLEADSNKLARVLDNLIKNAIYYSKEDSEIQVEMQQVNHQIIVAVRNTGKKIPKEKLEKIFEKFYRLDSARTSTSGGAGLGLAIAKEIVEAHGGRIYAKSDEKCTEFIVELEK